MHIYLGQMYPSPIDHRSIEYHYTKAVAHIAECTYTMTPPPIDHTSIEYHYTTLVSHIAECTYTNALLLQLTIDVWNTTTPHKCFTHSRMHIYPGKIPPI